jgi:hypothetical protein
MFNEEDGEQQYIERTDSHCKLYVKIDGEKKYIDAYPQFFQDAATELYKIRVSQFETMSDKNNAACECLGVEDGPHEQIMIFLNTEDVGHMVNDLLCPSDSIEFDCYEERIVKKENRYFYSASYTLPPELGDWPLSEFEAGVSIGSAMHNYILAKEKAEEIRRK